jgi:hypothetical protein
VPSRYEPTRELRELPNKWMFSSDSAPNEHEENILQYVIPCVNEDVSRVDAGVCAPRTRGA